MEFSNEELRYLSADDIKSDGSHDIPGYSVVLVYATEHCQYSKEFITIFRDIPRRTKNVRYGLIDMWRGMNRESRQELGRRLGVSSTPCLLFCYNGKILQVYTGSREKQAVINAFVWFFKGYGILREEKEEKEEKDEKGKMQKETVDRISGEKREREGLTDEINKRQK